MVELPAVCSKAGLDWWESGHRVQGLDQQHTNVGNVHHWQVLQCRRLRRRQFS